MSPCPRATVRRLPRPVLRIVLLPLAAAALAGCVRGTPVPGPLASLGRQARVWPAQGPSPDSPTPTASDRPAAPALPPTPDPGPGRPPPATDESPIVAAARHYLRTPPPSAFRDDCSGFVAAVLEAAERPSGGTTASLWADAQRDRRIHHRKRPEPGALAFFDDTWDRNGNGRLDDALTHVAVVLEVDRDGMITLAHAGTSAGRSTLRMNLKHPGDATAEDGTPLNDVLRARRGDDPARTVYLSAQLWRGFATPP